MGIHQRELPKGTIRRWNTKMTLGSVTLYGCAGDLHCQIDRVMSICHSLGVRSPETVHVLQPPATPDQPGWRRVTTHFALPGAMTQGAEGAVSPGKGHMVVMPVRGSHAVYVENLSNGRVGVARVRQESLSTVTGCCGAENVIQALCSQLGVRDPTTLRALIAGGGPLDMVHQIVDSLAKWGVQYTQVGYDGLKGDEPGLSKPEEPEQNWVFIHQTRS